MISRPYASFTRSASTGQHNTVSHPRFQGNNPVSHSTSGNDAKALVTVGLLGAAIFLAWSLIEHKITGNPQSKKEPPFIQKLADNVLPK